MEVPYIEAIISHLAKDSATYDTSRLFTSGCSMGSAFSIYTSQCIEHNHKGSITAFATHSTGLKIKGDGNNFPPDNYNRKYTWGECENGCKYWPTVVGKSSMKACIFDNAQDPSSNDPMFFRVTWTLN